VNRSRGGGGDYIYLFWRMWGEVVLCTEASVLVD
jgi:hypothetical protein